MASQFGERLTVSIFGESHGTGIGVVIDGLPAGIPISESELLAFLARRRGGQSVCSTARAEADMPQIQSGVYEGKTTGSPLCAVITNQDTRSKDYVAVYDTPRPSHADYTAYCKWGGASDFRGGGHFSGRLTASLCIAGGIAKQILAQDEIAVGAHLAQVGHVVEDAFPLYPTKELFAEIAAKPFPVINDQDGERMQQEIMQARSELDSVGGIIECAAIGIPAGWGNPMFDGMENRLSRVLFGIPAVKGVEFGGGFAMAAMRGSAVNDPFCITKDGTVATVTNYSGGIQGGITNGMPLRFRVAMKPTPSIAQPQQTVSLSRMEETTLALKGRHDPCVAHRAVPVVEAATALVLLDSLLIAQGEQNV